MENKRVIFQWIAIEIVQCACDEADNPIVEQGVTRSWLVPVPSDWKIMAMEL
jgi:hypothetical protein